MTMTTQTPLRRSVSNRDPLPPLLPLQNLHRRRRCCIIIIRSLFILLLCRIFLVIYILDVPKPIYHCPLVSSSLPGHQQLLWFDENCCWSTSYAEAREKFVALGNRLKEQTLLERDRNSESGDTHKQIIDVRSISYNIFELPLQNTANRDTDTAIMTDDITSSGNEYDLFTPQIITPGTYTVDAILITLRLSTNGVTETNSHEHAKVRESVNIIHSSGVHGIEGYLGSAIQIRFLHELLLLHHKRRRVENHSMHNHVHTTSASTSASSTTTSTISSGHKVQKILLIHSVNPYGMRHHRRTNENNVDLNRNVLSDATWKEVRTRHPNKYRYVDMDSMLNPFQSYNNIDDGHPFSWVDAARNGGYEGGVGDLSLLDMKVNRCKYQQSHEDQVDETTTDDIPMLELPPPISYTQMLASLWNEQKLVLQSLKSAFVTICTMGYTDAKRGIVSAQYHKPSGLSYGGGAHNNKNNKNSKWESSVLAVEHAIHEFAGFRFASSSSEVSSSTSSSHDDLDRTLWIDVHTGLGKYGEYSILTRDGMAAALVVEDEKKEQSSCSSHNSSWMAEFTSLLEQRRMGYGHSSLSASVSAGYEQTQGFMNDSILCPPPFCNGITQEFGTRPSICVIVALILENMGYHTSRNGGRTYGHFLTWAFNPQRLSWRTKSLRGGMDMLHTALEF